jgi:hypothetical protein
MPLALAEERADALTRDEHLAWCKRRALGYVDAGDLTHAVASMASDLYVADGDKAGVRHWIESFR